MITLNKKFDIDIDKAIVGLSGGPDSMALCHLLAKSTDIDLLAIHVNYGVSPESDQWEKICEDYCRQLNIKFKSYRVNLGNNLSNFESRAREARFKIFQSDGFSKFLFLGHNLNDQVETFFLKLGDGLRSLRAMNRITKFSDNLIILRPLLSYSRKEIMEYVKTHNIPHIQDNSNNDMKHDRNFIRHKVIPLLEERFPNFLKTMEKTLFALNDSKFCLDDLAEMDLKKVLTDDGKISIEKIKDLPLQRIRNLLQYYLINKNFTTTYNELISFSNNLVKVSYDKHLELSLKNRSLNRDTSKRYVLKQEGKFISIVEIPKNSNKQNKNSSSSNYYKKSTSSMGRK